MPKQHKQTTTNNIEAQAYQKGLAAFETGRYADAIEHLTIAADSNNLCAMLARFYLGQASMRLGIEHLRAGRHADALNHLTVARNANPDSAALSKYLAACYAGQRRFDLAAAEMERDETTGKPDAARPIRLAHAFARDGQLDRAIETLVKVIDLEPYRVDVRVQLGLLYGAAEHFEDAVCIFTEAAEIAPFDAEIQLRLGLALAAAGDHSESVEHLAIAQKLRPNDATIAMLLTMAIDAAQTTCIKLAIDPAQGTLGVVDDRSLETLGDLIANDPEFIESFLALPMTEADKELFAMLAAIIERALERQPGYADLYYHCSRVYDRLGMTREALTRADQAVEINPRYVQALIQLARMRAKTEESDKAICLLSDAVKYGGDYPDVHYLLGEMYRKRGEEPNARREYKRALELNSKYEAARALATALTA
ncbi:MAG: tetratricopeptide repeat protein [Planctomycetes bacterium]|nr:tetratricopeptide repeat protein [Planctomycetota bacterium]